jgi:serine/threonine protein kinase
VGLEPGLQPLPGYRLTRSIGRGAFGDVWEAQREDGQRVALKFLDTRTRSTSMIASEVRVLRGLAELHHPNIIQLHAVTASSKYLILVMERADGNLADLRAAYVKQHGRNIPPDHALELLAQAAAALDFLASIQVASFRSSRGLQHCDVKPTNLLVVGDTLKVADFGLCAGAGWMTHLGGWKGTLPYAAPELFHGSAVTGTDQYALAVTYCELVFGERAFHPSACINGSLTGQPVDLTKLREREFPVIARALHAYPSSRFPSCKAFVDALRKAAMQSRTTRTVRGFPRVERASLPSVNA